MCLYVSADSAASEPVFIMLCTKARTQKGVPSLREKNTQITGAADSSVVHSRYWKQLYEKTYSISRLSQTNIP